MLCVESSASRRSLAGIATPAMSASPVVFAPTGTVQTYVVPATGTFVVEAAGAQGGDATALGARVSGMFFLRSGELLKLVVGRRGLAGAVGARGGDSLVWIGADLPQPIRLMLSARGGGGAASTGDRAPDTSSFEPGDPAIDGGTATVLATQWTAGGGSGKGAARIDRCGYNAGSFRKSAPGVQAGNGSISIALVDVGARSDASPVAPTAPGSATAPAEVPSQSLLPKVTPRPSSWSSLLRRRTGSSKDPQ